jgi:mRNA-degrading endonuclease RelE of RelBE toxin-antitoxin system
VTTKIKIGAAAENFIKTLAPEPRRALRRGIKGLEKNAGDIKQLEGELSEYCRLRVGRMRVIFSVEIIRGERLILCHYVNFRPVVYQLFGHLLASSLLEQIKES